jgi:ribosomal protein S18 acetylase RimI-like enzyme
MDARDLERVARLHVECLPRSLIGALGHGYVRSFYRYVARSEKEIVVIGRRDDGLPVAAAVLSLEPATLNRRLLVKTQLALSMLESLPRLFDLFVRPLFQHRGREEANVRSAAPQLILIFTSPAERGRGRGSALIREIEEHLRERGIVQYEVRTESEPSNPALEFYRRNGFDPEGTSVRFGTRFQIFTRSLVPSSSGPAHSTK